MRYAILSDIHANLEALNASLEVCQKMQVDQYLCLGDLVGYNADPQACMDIVRQLPGLVMVKGNHDDYVSSGDNTMEGFNPHARDAILWTRAHLSPESLEWLSKLPYRVSTKGGITLVHATLDSPEAWGYVFDIHHANDNFAYQFTPFCFCGHSHAPIAFCKRPTFGMQGAPSVIELPDWLSRPEDLSEINPNELDHLEVPVKAACKYFVNVGSIGQPRNHDPRASFAIYDTEEKILTRWRVPYDIATAQSKIREGGLPERLALRLEYGE